MFLDALGRKDATRRGGTQQLPVLFITASFGRGVRVPSSAIKAYKGDGVGVGDSDGVNEG